IGTKVFVGRTYNKGIVHVGSEHLLLGLSSWCYPRNLGSSRQNFLQQGSGLILLIHKGRTKGHKVTRCGKLTRRGRLPASRQIDVEFALWGKSLAQISMDYSDPGHIIWMQR